MPKIRKLEYFEDQLRVTPLGREVLDVVRTHAKEVMYLVNKNRPTMVCWQRHHGPKFIKSVVDSGFEEDVEFVKEVEGVTDGNPDPSHGGSFARQWNTRT